MKWFFPELIEPARLTAARPVSACDTGGPAPAAGARCGQSDEMKRRESGRFGSDEGRPRRSRADPS